MPHGPMESQYSELEANPPIAIGATDGIIALLHISPA